MAVLQAEAAMITAKPARIQGIEADLRSLERFIVSIKQALYTPEQLEDPAIFREAYKALQMRMQARHKDDREAFMKIFIRENMEDFMPTDRMADIRAQKLGFKDKFAAFEELIAGYNMGLHLQRDLRNEKQALINLETDFEFLQNALKDPVAMGHFENIAILKERYGPYCGLEADDPDMAEWAAKSATVRRID